MKRKRTKVVLLLAALAVGGATAALAQQSPDRPERPPGQGNVGSPPTFVPPPFQGDDPGPSPTRPPRPQGHPSGGPPPVNWPVGVPQHVNDGENQGICMRTDGRGGEIRNERGEKVADIPVGVWGSCYVPF
jgi:hypothetical protein